MLAFDYDDDDDDDEGIASGRLVHSRGILGDRVYIAGLIEHVR